MGSVAPRVSIAEAKVFVEGEDEICQGDLATLQVTIKRANLRDNEAVGSAHTPFFPSATVPEAWWLLVTLPGKGAPTRAFRSISSGSDIVVERKFKVTQLGKSRCKVKFLSDTYLGTDLEETVSFDAKPPVEDERADVFEGEEDESDDE